MTGSPLDPGTPVSVQMSLEQLSLVVQQVLAETGGHAEANVGIPDDDDWSLTGEQMLFMLKHHNEIEAAFNSDDMQSLRDLAATEEFKSVFEPMGFDEAYDRYTRGG